MPAVDEAAGLDEIVIERAMDVSAAGSATSVGRVLIDGAVVIYNCDDPPLWLRPVLYAQDEDGSPLKAMTVKHFIPHPDIEFYEIRYDAGEAITGPRS